MTTAEQALAGASSPCGDDRLRELQAFDDTKAGVKGLVDAGTTTVPAIFRHPPESLSLEVTTSSSATTDAAIPVVDLLGAPREEVAGRVREAAETVGFFQVVNHGVEGDVLAAMLTAVRRFHEQPAEAKRPYYTRDRDPKVRFNSNFDLFQSPAASWYDTIFCDMAPEPPLPEELPEPLRGVIFEYAHAVRKVALLVFELLSESLGLACDHLREMGCVDSLSMVCHYYPPCPEPHLTLGAGSHTDPVFLTVLLQDAVGGLQVLMDHGGGRKGWVDVPHLHGALIVNVGDLLQAWLSLSFIIDFGCKLYVQPDTNCCCNLVAYVVELVSNGRFRSVEHRVVANRSRDMPRVSVASFCNADMKRSTRLYSPITELTSLDGGNPPLYKSVTVREFMAHFHRKGLDNRPRLDYFKLEQGTPM